MPAQDRRPFGNGLGPTARSADHSWKASTSHQQGVKDSPADGSAATYDTTNDTMMWSEPCDS